MVSDKKIFILFPWVANILILYMMLVVIVKFITFLYPFGQWPNIFNQSMILQYAYQTGDGICDFLDSDETKKVTDGYHIGRILKFIR